jgi:hypothetical protein
MAQPAGSSARGCNDGTNTIAQRLQKTWHRGGDSMEILIWIGTALTVAGILGLLWCVKLVLGIKKRNLPDAETKTAMQRVIALNMAALFISAIGLMMVVVGVILA